jgi:6-phosphofructokinase 1
LKGPLEALSMPLDLAKVKPILAKGGTILGS